jgi:hypothetical protein
VYADWLQENGREPRAEFIRLQVEAAWPSGDARREEMATRAGQLLKAHAREWIAPFGWLSPGGEVEFLPVVPVPGESGGALQLNWTDPSPSIYGDPAAPYERTFDFHRGFLRAMYLEAEAVASAPSVGPAVGPLPQAFVGWHGTPATPDWAARLWPNFRRGLLSLPHSGWMFSYTNHEVGWLPQLADDAEVARGLVGLSVEGGSGVRDADVIRLLPQTPRLDMLRLTYWEWSPAVVAAMGRYGLNRRLRYFDFRNNANAAGPVPLLVTLAELARCGPWPELRSLYLDGLEGADAATAAVPTPGLFPSLKVLSLWGPGGTVAFFEALLANPALAHVERIEWFGFNHAGRAFAALAQKSGGRFVVR